MNYICLAAFLFIVGITYAIVGLIPREITDITRIPNKGQITKIAYGNHSYVAWSCNLGCSMVHDPDCKCLKERNNANTL